MSYISQLLYHYNLDEKRIKYFSCIIMVLVILIICILVNIILNKIVLRIITRIIMTNKYRWDNVLLQRKIFQRLFYIAPAVIVYIFAPTFVNIQEIIRRTATTYILIISIFVVSACLDAIDDIYRQYPISKVRPMKGLIQVIKIVIYIVFGIIIIANLMEKDPLILLSGIGALAAVFSFVFKDSILGFIAGIQLTSNDMLRIGDWIEMSRYGADGDVIDITLNTVKVQNFDKTIITIPAYAMVSDSFRNWRGMLECGGRRIKRSIYIDVNSIHFCTPEMIEKFKQIKYLKDYIMEKEEEIKAYNKKHQDNTEMLINGRHLTNIGTFRAYVEFYLKSRDDLNKNMTLAVRQLAPDQFGLAIEIYAFTNSTVWIDYEKTQSDIFDHILSIVEVFELRVFQSPTGYDMMRKL